jgi:hypothetical protein
MIDSTKKLILVGDNPFHGISHLSQEQARNRTDKNDSIARKADIVATAIKNGADGFSFSVSDVTLSILKELRARGETKDLKLYAIVPYAFEYVRIATQMGTPGLAKRFVKQIAFSGDIGAIFGSLGTLLTMSPERLMKTYLAYEISRIRSAAGKRVVLSSLLLHEVITDMGLALNFDWLFKSFISYMIKKGITPGFNTRNFPLLQKKFNEWNINLDQTLIETQFNKVGFQMNPSKEECEKTLSSVQSPIVLAISVLAAGYLKPSEALDYVVGLEKLKGAVMGVSSEEQARELFPLFKSGFSKK